MDVRVGPSRRLSTEELMLLNCGVGEDSWDPLGQHGDQTINPKGNQLWIFIERTDAEAEALVLWPCDAKNQLIGKDWYWERLRAGGEGGWQDEIFGWHHCYEHEFEQTLEEWRAEKPDVLQSIGSQKIQTYWVTEQLKSTLGIPWSWENFGCWWQRLCP